MITVLALEARRMWRRRLSLLLLVVPVFLVLASLIGHWLRHPVPGPLQWTLILASSVIVYCQALLSDREGHLDLAFASSRVSRKCALARHVLLLVMPLALQAAVFVAFARLLRV